MTWYWVIEKGLEVLLSLRSQKVTMGIVFVLLCCGRLATTGILLQQCLRCGPTVTEGLGLAATECSPDQGAIATLESQKPGASTWWDLDA